MSETVENTRKVVAYALVGAFLAALAISVFRPDEHQLVVDLTPPMLIAIGWLFGPAIMGREKDREPPPGGQVRTPYKDE